MKAGRPNLNRRPSCFWTDVHSGRSGADCCPALGLPEEGPGTRQTEPSRPGATGPCVRWAWGNPHLPLSCGLPRLSFLICEVTVAIRGPVGRVCGRPVGGGLPQIHPNKRLLGQREEEVGLVAHLQGLSRFEGPKDLHPIPALVSAARDPRASLQGEQRPLGAGRAQCTCGLSCWGGATYRGRGGPGGRDAEGPQRCRPHSGRIPAGGNGPRGPCRALVPEAMDPLCWASTGEGVFPFRYSRGGEAGAPLLEPAAVLTLPCRGSGLSPFLSSACASTPRGSGSHLEGTCFGPSSPKGSHR